MKKLTVLLLILFGAGCATTGSADKVKLAEGYYLKGLSYLEQKNLELASVEFQRSIQTDKKNKMSYYALGIISDMQDKPKDAEKFYREAIDIDSDFSEAHNALGVVYAKQQRWKEAFKAFSRALDNKLYTTPHISYVNIGDAYMAQREFDKAVEAYRESKRFVNSDFTIMKLGMALFEAGRIKDSIAELQEGVALNSKNVMIRYNLALAHLKDGNKKSAVVEFKKVVDFAPESDLAGKAKDYLKQLKP